MPEALVITPVKDSFETTALTIKAISNSIGSFEYLVYNDFSLPETKKGLEKLRSKYNFDIIHLEEITNTPSPNYKLVLTHAQNLAIQKNCPLLIIESDVIVESKTIQELIDIMNTQLNPGMVGAITVDKNSQYNFPYNFEKVKSNKTINTSHSLSFCCTLLTLPLLKTFDFSDLSDNKDWFDVFISKKSKKLGFHNYLAKGTEVLHLPHSSRPWKNLKYTNPLLYYFRKYFYKRDRI